MGERVTSRTASTGPTIYGRWSVGSPRVRVRGMVQVALTMYLRLPKGDMTPAIRAAIDGATEAIEKEIQRPFSFEGGIATVCGRDWKAKKVPRPRGKRKRSKTRRGA